MRIPLLLAATILATPAMAQDMSGHDHHANTPAPSAEPQPHPDSKSDPMNHATMDHTTMDHAAGAMHGMVGALGDYSMMRDASGTAWGPDSAPMMAIMGNLGDWSTMVHGNATLTWDKQGGPRGGEKTFVTSMLMGMAQRPLGGGTLTLRAMGSLDPLMGKRGYPLLLATGETADGRTELVDRQHPHDAFMELAASYSHPLGEGVSGFVYLGLPGEPALGPGTFMHRFSGLLNPEAPIAHHWLDSTHVTFGVATAGIVAGPVKVEGSLFTGREPDQHRWNIERPRFDSWSARVNWNPTANLALQVSHGYLESPESLHPDTNVHRTTASASWNLPLGESRNFQTTFAWGRNAPTGGDHGHTTDAFLLEGALQLGRWTLFGRGENTDKGELFGDEHDGDPLAGRVFNVSKFSLGGFHTIPVGKVALDMGGLVSTYALPGAIKPVYGGNPTSGMLFTRLRITG